MGLMIICSLIYIGWGLFYIIISLEFFGNIVVFRLRIDKKGICKFINYIYNKMKCEFMIKGNVD